MPEFIRCQIPTFCRVTKSPRPNMIASTTTEPTKMKTRNNFIADAFGTDRSARNVNNGTSGPAGPIPKAPWRSSGIGNMPPITIDAAQSASAIPAGAAHRHLPDKSCSAPVSRSLLQRRRQLHCRSKNCVKCRNVFFSSFCSSDSAKNQVGADSLSRNYREFTLPMPATTNQESVNVTRVPGRAPNRRRISFGGVLQNR